MQSSHSKPHSYMGIPEANKVLRLCESGDAQGMLNGMAFSMGLASPATDAATVIRRMKKAAEDALRWHGN